jgi:bifunctional UDP-N-acetylglucosamine pyrophosphorylase/glucosamine-1-phosphate N-acetyltransferase
MGDSVIGEESLIGPNTILKDAKVGNHAKVVMSSVSNAEIKDGEEIGPFANVK